MSKFEDQLFADLMSEHGGELATTRRTPGSRRGTARHVLGAAGAVGVAGAVGLGITAVASATPAYAVTRAADGTITVSLRDISGVTGANAELRKLGVSAVAVPMAKNCTAKIVPDGRSVRSGVVSASNDAGGSGSVSFPANSIATGDTLVLAAQVSDRKVSLALITVRGSAPACVPENPVPAPTPDNDGAIPPAPEKGTGTSGHKTSPDKPEGVTVGVSPTR
jgi:hypothetical protein